MHSSNHSVAVPFQPGEWLSDTANPTQVGRFTGKTYKAGPYVMVEVQLPDGSTKHRPLHVLTRLERSSRGTIDEQLFNGRFGRIRDLQRLLTFEKLKGTLHEIIYSMEAAQVDFYAYQFKPVLKFIESPTERLLIADEVGLGKTIESMLIWLELVARRQARRLLVVCPKSLQRKWQIELRTKFMIDAQLATYEDVACAVDDVKQIGASCSCALIATYSGLRPPKDELLVLDHELNFEGDVSPKTRLLHELRQWDREEAPFDLVVFDEAHHMRNSATATFHVGEALARSAGAVLCVSATPINNKNTDLHSLLRLIDPDFFQTAGTFDALLEANRPTVQAGNALARFPVESSALVDAVTRMRTSRYIAESPLLKDLDLLVHEAIAGDRRAIARAQAIVEKLNLLGAYVNRTRRVHVNEERPLREPVVLTLEYAAEERALYDAILQLVRRRCAADGRAFHVFQVLGLQLRAASCLPALVEEIRAGRLGSVGEILGEAFADDPDAVTGELPEAALEGGELAGLLQYDFEANDGKYRELRRLLLEMVPHDKVVVFSFYRATLAYLQRRLVADGIPTVTIHGDTPNEERLHAIETVRDSESRMILLSSEVGAEGLDLQFCRVVVNYDLPWNPMRIEQRIGRIDRVGQTAKKLSVVNFKIRDTVEERLFDRLLSKLDTFSSSLGDLEEIIGREVRDLTVRLMTQQLTPEQELRLMDQTRLAIEQKILQEQALEESGDAIVSLSDYLQRQLQESRSKGRFVVPDELEDYVRDFFEREFPGCELACGVPRAGCFTLRLSPEAHRSLVDYLGDNTSPAAHPFRQREVAISFRREVVMQLPVRLRPRVTFVNHLSPLVRWITSRHRCRPGAFCPVAAVDVQTDLVRPGLYAFRVERWTLTGLLKRERLAYSVTGLHDGAALSEDTAESLVQKILREGTSWQYPEYPEAQLRAANGANTDLLDHAFKRGVEAFQGENQTACQIRTERVTSIFERRLAQDRRRLTTARESGRSERVIRLIEGSIRKNIELRDAKVAQLEARREVDCERAPVAAGIVRVCAHR